MCKSRIDELKKQYNKLLTREQNAEQWIDKSTEEEYTKWLPEFQKIMQGLNDILNELRKLGFNCTENETVNGFSLEVKE